MDQGDSWTTFMKRVWDNVKQRRLRWAWRFAGIVVALTLMEIPSDRKRLGAIVFTALAAWLVLTVSAPAWRGAFHWLSRGRYFASTQSNPLVSGAIGLLVVLLIGLPLPLMLKFDGETLDSPRAVGTEIINALKLRRLYLSEQVLLANAARPETIADLRSKDPAKMEAAQRSIERVNLQGRSLRGAWLDGALMPLADLRDARLQGANLLDAQLQGANLRDAQLQGAHLERAQLQGANLRGVQLQGADLRRAELYTKLMPLDIELVDARGLKWSPLAAKKIEDLEQLKKIANDWYPAKRDQFLKRIYDAIATAGLEPPTIESCLSDKNPQITCKKTYDLIEFRQKLSEVLVELACQSSRLANRIVWRVFRESRNKDSVTIGLATRLQDIRKKGTKDSCPGLFSLAEEDAATLTATARSESR